jgi:hypothetical protein
VPGEAPERRFFASITWGFFHASLHPHQGLAAIVVIAAVAMVHHVQQLVEPDNLKCTQR